ncbi:hypothetical protein [Actinomadura sp. 9N407]|uniref:hypothetical protein n=1 Tax=Actinomadura sp. 9N407 TaxID=3375154 RepID=UPI00378F224B
MIGFVLAGIWTLFIGFVLVFAVASIVAEGEPEPKAAVPEKLTGHWSGTYQRADGGSKMKVSLILHQGRVRGEISYPHGECNGSLTPLGVDPEGAFVVREYTGDDRCQDSDLHITHKDGELRVEYTDQGEMAPSAFIKKMKKAPLRT